MVLVRPDDQSVARFYGLAVVRQKGPAIKAVARGYVCGAIGFDSRAKSEHRKVRCKQESDMFWCAGSHWAIRLRPIKRYANSAISETWVSLLVFFWGCESV